MILAGFSERTFRSRCVSAPWRGPSTSENPLIAPRRTREQSERMSERFIKIRFLNRVPIVVKVPVAQTETATRVITRARLLFATGWFQDTEATFFHV